jgi:hypothetical protein
MELPALHGSAGGNGCVPGHATMRHLGRSIETVFGTAVLCPRALAVELRSAEARGPSQ